MNALINAKQVVLANDGRLLKKSFLGTGWKFPPSFDIERKEVAMVSDEQDIEESLVIILNTSVGERIMRPDFGSKLNESVFDVINGITMEVLKDSIQSAILNFEPRVTLNDVLFNLEKEHEGVLEIELVYTIRSINIRTNIVFPFYFKEGTNVTGM